MPQDIRVRINGEERQLSAADAQWVHQTLEHRPGQCIEVLVRADGVNVRLASCSCTGSAGGGRAPNAREQEILELWRTFRLGNVDCNLHELWPFLVQLRKHLGLRPS
jgi:hypothetical protein